MASKSSEATKRWREKNMDRVKNYRCEYRKSESFKASREKSASQRRAYRARRMQEIKADPEKHAAFVAYHRKWQRDRRELLQKKQNARNRSLKERLVEAAGGKCCRCGYSKCIAALEFHHPDPHAKEFTLAQYRVFERALREAKKCELVCANCHREIHASMPPVKRGRPRIPDDV